MLISTLIFPIYFENIEELLLPAVERIWR